MPATSQESLGAPLKLKYFDFKAFGGPAARGGAVRFFLLAAGIEFAEDKVQYDDKWPAAKQELISSGESLFGTLPVITLGDRQLTECHAMLRRFSKQLGLYGDDIERDYLIDSLADATVAWRWQYVSAAFGGGTKDKYLSTERPLNYNAFEKLLERTGASGPFTVPGNRLSMADALLFCQLWDDVVISGDEELKQRSHLLNFYKAFIAQPAVAAWCEDNNPKAAAAVSKL